MWLWLVVVVILTVVKIKAGVYYTVSIYMIRFFISVLVICSKYFFLLIIYDEWIYLLFCRLKRMPNNKMPIIIFDFLLCDVIIMHEIILFVINLKGKLKDIVTSNSLKFAYLCINVIYVDIPWTSNHRFSRIHFNGTTSNLQLELLLRIISRELQ